MNSVRNKNPLNIVKGFAWKGLSNIQSDSRFCKFVSIEYGFRARYAVTAILSFLAGNNI